MWVLEIKIKNKIMCLNSNKKYATMKILPILSLLEFLLELNRLLQE